MEKNIIERLIEARIITEQDIDEYNRQKSTSLIKQAEQAQPTQENEPYSRIENGILKKFDERDLISGTYRVPKNVVIIGREAFKSCQRLEKINLANVTQIYNDAFAYCTNLRMVKFGKNLKYIDKYAFWRCENLEPINLDVKSTTIHWTAFMHCPNWEHVSKILLERGKAGEEIEWYH